jgi:hypothetical protein
MEKAKSTNHLRKKWNLGLCGLLIVAVVIFHAIYSIRLNLSIWRSNEHPDISLIFSRTDPIFKLAAANSKTTFIEFQGFDPTPADVDLARLYFIRAAYELTPGRVLIADPSADVFQSEDLIKNNFYPDDVWLDSHHVDMVVIIRHTQGQVQIQLKLRAKESA